MKVEKDNLCDRLDAVEEALKVSRQRQEKAEEEATDLTNKQKQLEMEVDVYGERLSVRVIEQQSK